MQAWSAAWYHPAAAMPLSENSPTIPSVRHADRRRGLVAWFIANPVAANLLMVLLLVGGALSAMNLRSQVFPTISPGTVVVTTPIPGATPAEVEEGIAARRRSRAGN